MPVHDWRKVETGTFHAFHNAWNTQSMGKLNGGIFPKGHDALAEQYVQGRVPDVLTSQVPEAKPHTTPVSGARNRAIALVDSPPRVRHRLIADEHAAYRARQRTLTVRRTSGHHIVAMLEIVSPANKDRVSSVQDFAKKVEAALIRGVHVLVADLILPGKHDPRGVHGEIWSRYAASKKGDIAEWH